MRRGMRRIRRAVKRTTAAVVVFAIALGLFASLPPSTLRDIEDSLHRIPRVLGNAVRPTAERVPERLREPTSARRNSNGSGHRRVTISGAARVIDGDTMDVRGTRIRLFGIDAPEREQTCRDGSRRWACGQRATRALHDRIGNRPVRCDERDREQRIVAVCRAGTDELNRWMVLEGWALAYRRYSRSYVDEEGRARAAKRGVWRSEFVPPWDWRRGKRLAGAGRTVQRQAARGCRADRAARQGRVPHQGKYQHEWKAHLPRSGRTALRKGPHRHPKGREVVLLRVGGKARRVATVTRVAPGAADSTRQGRERIRRPSGSSEWPVVGKCRQCAAGGARACPEAKGHSWHSRLEPTAPGRRSSRSAAPSAERRAEGPPCGYGVRQLAGDVSVREWRRGRRGLPRLPPMRVTRWRCRILRIRAGL